LTNFGEKGEKITRAEGGRLFNYKGRANKTDCEVRSDDVYRRNVSSELFSIWKKLTKREWGSVENIRGRSFKREEDCNWAHRKKRPVLIGRRISIGVQR